jgi:DNA-binding SARP family transcriptional activator/tetratricopeptide (TPR) repeat protein
VAREGGDRRYRLLGPLEVTDEGVPIEIATAKQKALLTILLLRANRVVPTEVMIDELWAGDPPASAATTLHGYVSGLRKALGRDVIRTAAPGYVIDVAPGALDTERFEHLRAEGTAALAAEDWPAATTALRAALGLWSGAALSDVATEPFARADAVRLDQARLAATDGWARAELAQGHHATVAVDLERSVAEAPLREDLRARLVLALYRCGRQAEALRSLAVCRRLLVDEVGIDPGPELVALESAILAQDPGLAWSPDDARETQEPRPASAPAVNRVARAGLIGRDPQLTELLDDLSAALNGDGRLALVAGEPGIGKTRLAEEIARIGAERGATVAWGRCYDGVGAPAHWPWDQAIRDLLQRVGASNAIGALGDRAAEVALVAPAVTAIIDAPPAQPAADLDAARFRAYDATSGFIRSLAHQRPLVLVLEDLHWADAPSLELLTFLARDLNDVPVLIVATFRTIDPTVSAALTEALARVARGPSRRIALHGLTVADVARFLGDETDDIAADVHRRTQGNPFFVGEVARWMASDTGQRDGVPVAVGDVIRERVGRLPPAAAAALADASILGQQLDAELLGAIIGLEPLPLLDLLAPALAAGVLVGDGLRGRWRFSHGLISETLLAGLDLVRRTDLHLRAAAALRDRHGDIAGPHLAVRAQHLVDARPVASRDETVEALTRAADWAAGHLAPDEAARHFHTALDVLAAAPAGADRDIAELGVQEQLSRLLLTTTGYGAPGLDTACARMRELCARLDENHQLLVPALWRLSTFHTVRTELDTAIELGRQLLDLGLTTGDPGRLMVGHMAMGTIGTHRSEFLAARDHLDTALALCRAGHDAAFADLLPETPLIWTLVFSAWNHWAIGEPEEAEREVLEAVALGRSLGDGPSYPKTFALWFAGLIATLRRQPRPVVERCDAGLECAIAGGFSMFVPFMSINRGWAVGAEGDADAGLAAIAQGSAGIGGAGVRMLRHVFPALAADVLIRAGRAEDAIVHVERGLAAAEETGERWFEAELHRLHALVLIDRGELDAAQDALARAVEVASRQGAETLRQRAVESMADLEAITS